MLYGAIIEGVATMLCRITSKILSDNEPQYANAIDSFVATALVVAGKRICQKQNPTLVERVGLFLVFFIVL